MVFESPVCLQKLLRELYGNNDASRRVFPTLHSKLTYNEAFRANQFVGAGIRPIYRLSQMFHLRGEFYGFMPIYPIEKNSLNKAYYGKAFLQV